MNILVTGANGQLGSDVVKELESRNIPFLATDREDLDITSNDEVVSFFTNNTIKGVIHCAAYTAVDAAEDNSDICRLINVEGTRNLAQECEIRDIPLMYISTDYVFDGKGLDPWMPDSERNPINVYGKMKYEGEVLIEKLLSKYFIVRISWVFGRNGKNFVDTMINLGLKYGKVSVVADQIGSPTYTKDLAYLLVDMIQTEKFGTYHATNEGYCSWYDFAVEIFKQKNMDVEVLPVESTAFPVKAKRPSNSRLEKSKLVNNGFSLLPSWKDALDRYIHNETCGQNE